MTSIRSLGRRLGSLERGRPLGSLVALPVLVGAVIASYVYLATAKSGHAAGQAAPIFGVVLPPGYRDFKLISVAREEGSLDDIRAVLGNDIALKAYRRHELPFPDGAIIARLAWSLVPSEPNNEVFGRAQSFVAGTPKNGVQFMVKDSKRYATSGGWGFAQFDDEKPATEAKHRTCLPCHEAGKQPDLVFTHYAP